MEQLKVGDKVCLVQNRRFDSMPTYYFSEVVRLTKTMAVLANGKKLINESKAGICGGDPLGFPQHGKSWDRWRITTPEILEASKIEQQRIKIFNWFKARRFTDSKN